MHQSTNTTLPWSPFLHKPVQQSSHTKLYGNNGRNAHQGIDFFAPKGFLVQSSHEGIVQTVMNDQAYGTMVVIANMNGYKTLYAHLASSFLQEGDWVLEQSPLGLVGDSGDASGYHVHFELLFEGVPIDPSPYILQP